MVGSLSSVAQQSTRRPLVVRRWSPHRWTAAQQRLLGDQGVCDGGEDPRLAPPLNTCSPYRVSDCCGDILGNAKRSGGFSVSCRRFEESSTTAKKEAACENTEELNILPLWRLLFIRYYIHSILLTTPLAKNMLVLHSCSRCFLLRIFLKIICCTWNRYLMWR